MNGSADDPEGDETWRRWPLPGFNDLVRARHGLMVANRNDLYVGRSLIDYGEYSEAEWLLLSRLCRPGDLVVEVGANIGALTVPLARAVGPGGRVVALEPQPIIFQTLCANLALNGLLNVEAHHAAAGRQAGQVTIPAIDYGVENNFGAVPLLDAASGTPVAVRPLNEICRHDQPKLIKIDVEGMEAEVIAGGRELISRSRPVLYVENDRPANSQALIALIRGLGYGLWWHAVALFNPQNHFANAHNRFGRAASINMLCLPAEKGDEAELAAELTPVDDSDFHPLA